MDRKVISKGKVGQALSSAAADHILGTADEIFDENQQRYQEDINADLLNNNIEYNLLKEDEQASYTLTEAINKVPEEYQIGGLKLTYRAKNGQVLTAILSKANWNTNEENWFIQPNLDEHYEFIYSILDKNGRILLGIKKDGTSYIPKGLSEDGKKEVQRIIGLIQELDTNVDKRLVKIEGELVEFEHYNYVYAVVDSLQRVLFAVEKDGTSYIPKLKNPQVINHEGRLQIIEGEISEVEAGSYIYAIVDTNKKVLFGIKKDGTSYIPKGISVDTQLVLDEIWEHINTLERFVYSKIQEIDNDEFVYAIVDKVQKLLFGIDKNGNAIFPKNVVAGNVNQEYEESKDYLYYIVDKNKKLLFGIDKNGKLIGQRGINLDEKTSIDFVDSQSWVFAILDTNKKVVFGIDKNAAIYCPKIKGVANITQEDSNEFIYEVIDKNNHLLFAIRKDGTFIAPKFEVAGISNIEEKEFIYVILDKNSRICWGIQKSGNVYQPKGQPEETKEEIRKIVAQIKSIEKILNDTEELKINNIAIDKVMYDGNQGRAYLGNVALQAPGMTDYCIIMMYGQSLSNGSENPAGFYDAPIEGCYMLGNNVWNIAGSSLKPLSVEGTVREDGVAIGTRQDTIVSTVNAFVNLYRKERPWDKNTKFIACSLGVGGYTVAQLSGAARYPYCNAHILDSKVKPFFEAVKAIANNEGKTISLSAIFWKQGESDYGTGHIGKTYQQWKDSATEQSQVSAYNMSMSGSYDAYYKGLNYLKEDICALAKTIFGEDQQNRPVFMPYSVCGTYINNAYMTINAATQQLAEDYDDIIQVGPTYVTPDYNGGHLAMNGYRWFGEYCAKALYNVYLKGIDWTPLQPYNFEVQGNKIFIYLNPLVPPLRFDKYTIDGAYKNFGFSVRMGTVAQLDDNKTMTAGNLLQRITDIAIIENCIVLTCGDLEEFTGAVEISYAGQGESGYFGHNQGAGNLRDSDTWKSFYNYRQDEGDHGSRTSFNVWSSVRVATEQDLEDYEFWSSSVIYNYDDRCLYTNTSNNVTYLIKSNKDNNVNSSPFSSGLTWRTTNYWIGSSEATDEELETLEYLDENFLSSTGYQYGDKVLFNMIERIKPTVLTCNYGDVAGTVKCKVRPANPVNYHTEDVKGNTIVGKPYPMQNWCLNFYKRIILG